MPFATALLLALLLLVPVLSITVILSRVFRTLARRHRWIPADRRGWSDRNWIFRTAVGLLAFYGLVVVWSAWVEPRWLEVTRTEIAVAAPVLGYDRFRIVHLSDLHLERSGRLAARIVEAAREAQPHLIVLTGDSLGAREGGAALDEILGALRGIAPPMGVLAVGGHSDEKFITREIFRRAGVDYLEDETRVLQREGRRLRVAAQAVWPQATLRELLRGLDRETPTLYLRHDPAGADELRGLEAGQRVDLFLCGHTHGGQVCLPYLGALVPSTREAGPFERGLHRVGDVPMYVNRGIGFAPGLPLRLFSRPELAVLELVAK
jgi:predicted MPP superfamily phosphohydrolase